MNVEAVPNTGIDEFNRAVARGEEHAFAESEAAIKRAFAKGLDAPECWLILARALLGLGRFDEAETAFQQAIARRPIYPDAHSEMAQLIWMRSGDIAKSCAALDAVIAARPTDVDFRLIKTKLLEYAGQPAAAYSHLTEAAVKGASDPRIDIVAAQLCLATDPATALTHAERAQHYAPHDPSVLTILCQANLACGRPDAASAIAATLRAHAPRDQNAVALQATAWRIMGDRRYAELYDYDALVREWTIDVPPGWACLDAYLADLVRSLDGLHRLRAHPVGQSLRGGSQTTQNLNRVNDPTVQAFFQAVDGPIRQHIAATEDSGGYRFNGIWSIKLRPNGHHVSHVHPMGWISSACYIAIPETMGPDRQGWLTFGAPGIPTEPRLEPEHYVKPTPGKLVLFPSYMWHGTIPFTADGNRLTIAFDLANTRS